tara:strand:- start:2448 stop:2654 length:207 start_codon:yes stop_codon:yes gene_type:complete
MTLSELNYNDRDLLILEYKKSYKEVFGFSLPRTKEVLLIRNDISVKELRQRIIELDTLLLKRSLHSVY